MPSCGKRAAGRLPARAVFVRHLGRCAGRCGPGSLRVAAGERRASPPAKLLCWERHTWETRMHIAHVGLPTHPTGCGMAEPVLTQVGILGIEVALQILFLCGSRLGSFRQGNCGENRQRIVRAWVCAVGSVLRAGMGTTGAVANGCAGARPGAGPCGGRPCADGNPRRYHSAAKRGLGPVRNTGHGPSIPITPRPLSSRRSVCAAGEHVRQDAAVSRRDPVRLRVDARRRRAGVGDQRCWTECHVCEFRFCTTRRRRFS